MLVVGVVQPADELCCCLATHITSSVRVFNGMGVVSKPDTSVCASRLQMLRFARDALLGCMPRDRA